MVLRSRVHRGCVGFRGWRDPGRRWGADCRRGSPRGRHAGRPDPWDALSESTWLYFLVSTVLGALAAILRVALLSTTGPVMARC